MSANLEAKKALVDEIKEGFKNASSIVFADYRGVTVSEDTNLRKEMRTNNVCYKVYKNRLMVRALNELGITGFNPADLEGTTSVAFGADEVMPAKLVCKAGKDTNKMSVKFGILNGQVIDKTQVEAISKIPSKDVLIAMLLGTLNAPVAAFARALDAISKK